MAKVRDAQGHEIEGKSVVTEAQATAREHWEMRSGLGKADRLETQIARRAARTPEQQLAELNRRLGNGVGAKKERARLTALVSK